MTLFEAEEVCPRCGGTGKIYEPKIDGMKACPKCSQLAAGFAKAAEEVDVYHGYGAQIAEDLRSWRLADFDGATYEAPRDHERLGAQLLRVVEVMKDGEWHTLKGISEITKDPEASVSARIRDLRKGKFGGHTVEREFVSRGLWRYRLVRDQ